MCVGDDDKNNIDFAVFVCDDEAPDHMDNEKLRYVYTSHGV
jgi:hypothetical protein